MTKLEVINFQIMCLKNVQVLAQSCFERLEYYEIVAYKVGMCEKNV